MAGYDAGCGEDEQSDDILQENYTYEHYGQLFNVGHNEKNMFFSFLFLAFMSV